MRYEFVITLDIKDERELRRHAEALATNGCMSPEEWGDMRLSIKDDIIMALDPYVSPPGIGIVCSTVNKLD